LEDRLLVEFRSGNLRKTYLAPTLTIYGTVQELTTAQFVVGVQDSHAQDPRKRTHVG